MSGRLARSHPLWFAHILHRASGLGLALFLPLHFWVLARLLTDTKQVDGFLKLTDIWAFKFAEFGLVFLLAVHLFGGLRLMALELLPWSSPQKTWAAAALVGSGLVAIVFLVRAL